MNVNLQLTQRQLDILNYACLEYLYQLRKLEKELHLDITKEEIEQVLKLIGENQKWKKE